MNKILIPTDGTELADYAYNLAHKIAQQTGAEIHALGIVPAPANAIYDLEGNIKEDEGEDLSQMSVQKEQKLLELNAWQANKPDVKVVKTKIGRIEEDILNYITCESVDLVVMGTKGASGINEFLRSSHTAHIVRASPVPVLSVKCDRSSYEIHDILLISDFHEEGELNLGIIKTMMEVFQANLHLLKINTLANFETTREVRQNMRRFEALHGLHHAEHHIYCDNSVEEGIIHFSADTGIDFVAIGTHQRKGLGRLFRHSVSEELVNHIWQPILTFKV